MEDVYVGAAEAREILGVELQRISRWRRAGKLPPPYAVLASSPVWRRADIQRFADEGSDAEFADPPDPPALMGTAEVAKRLEVDKSQIGRWRDKPSRAGLVFPAPVARLKAGPVWNSAEIEQFAAQRNEIRGETDGDSQAVSENAA